VALNVGVIDALQKLLETPVITTPLAQYGGALGAALLAED